MEMSHRSTEPPDPNTNIVQFRQVRCQPQSTNILPWNLRSPYLKFRYVFTQTAGNKVRLRLRQATARNGQPDSGQSDREAAGANEKLLPTPSARQESSASSAVTGGLHPNSILAGTRTRASQINAGIASALANEAPARRPSARAKSRRASCRCPMPQAKPARSPRPC